MRKVNQLWINKQRNEKKIILEINADKGTNQRYLLSLKQASQISLEIEETLKRIRKTSDNAGGMN